MNFRLHRRIEYICIIALFLALLPPSTYAAVNSRILYIAVNTPDPSKFSILCMRNGIKLETKSVNSIPSDLSSYKAAIIRFSDGQSDYPNAMNNVLTTLYSYVKAGGTVFCEFTYWNNKTLDLLMDLYGVAIANEIVVSTTNLLVDGGVYFDFWRQLKIGGYKDKALMRGYLEVIGSPLGDITGIGLRSNAGSKIRKVSAAVTVGKGRFIAVIAASAPDCGYCPKSFFEDDKYDLLENEEALKRLITFLVDNAGLEASRK